MRILLVDDCPFQPFLSQLKAKGICIYTAKSLAGGLTRLDEAAGNPYYAVICDLHILENDHTTEAVQRWGEALLCAARHCMPPEIPVIIASAGQACPDNVHKDVVICCGRDKYNADKLVERITLWRSGELGIAELSKQGLVGTRACQDPIISSVSRLHELRHNILSPLLPLSISLQAFFAEGEFKTEQAFLLLDPASEDYYCTIKQGLLGCDQLIEEMLALTCAAEGSPHYHKTAADADPSWAEQIKCAVLCFVHDPDLLSLCELLASSEFEKHPDEKGNPQPAYYGLLKALEEYGSQRAHRLVDGIDVLSKNLQKVIDYVEQGEISPPEAWGDTP